VDYAAIKYELLRERTPLLRERTLQAMLIQNGGFSNLELNFKKVLYFLLKGIEGCIMWPP
jgi:hypothetical protein